MKNFISFILLFLFVNSNVHGQPKYGLSNYRIPVGKKGSEIATVFHSSIKDPELRILEDASGICKVKKNRLFLKANRKVNASAKPLSLKLSIGGEFLEVDLVADNFIMNKV